jgi:hypothetical protein
MPVRSQSIGLKFDRTGLLAIMTFGVTNGWKRG